MKIKMVKTELPYCMTVVFEDGKVKYYNLSRVSSFSENIRHLTHSSYEFLKPYIGVTGNSVIWYVEGGTCIEFSAEELASNGEYLSDHDIDYHTNYFEMRSFFQSTEREPYERYSFNCPFTVRVAHYINYDYDHEEAAERHRKIYGEFINRHANLLNVGVFEDEKNKYYPNSLDAPQLTRLIQKCKDGEVDVIFTDSIFEFANTVTASVELVNLLVEIGVMVYFYREPYFCDDYIFSTITYMHREMTTERSLPQSSLGRETVLRVLDPKRKSPYGEIEKYMDLPYQIIFRKGFIDNCGAEIPELGYCRASGRSPEHAIANLKEIQLRRIEELLKSGKKVPLPKKVTNNSQA